MIAEGCCVVVSGPLTDNLKNILIKISYIIDKCNKKPSGQIKLKRLYCGNIIKDILNIFESKVKKGRLEFNDLIKEFNDIKDLYVYL
jgi:hypothetical protein